jgi:hypothetical protein
VSYLDSGSATRKNYTDIKGVLGKVLNGFTAKAGPVKNEKKARGCFTFFHKIEFLSHK